MLRTSYMSLVNLADDPGRVEFLAALDPDDPWVHESWPLPWTRMQVTAWVASERYGIWRLHEYYNRLARQARGKWLMLWNDDAEMLTQGWDSLICERSCNQCLQPWHSNGGYTHNDFPVWPKEWSDFLGHVSPTRCVDAAIDHVALRIGRMYPIQVQIRHDRPDQMIIEHLGTDAPGDLLDPAIIRQMDEDADRLREKLEAAL